MKDATLDIAYDLCRTCLGTPSSARKVVRVLQRRIKRANGSAYVAHRIPWLLSMAYGKMRSTEARPFLLSADEQLALDKDEQATHRLEAWMVYFQRLTLVEKVTVLLLHKHGVSRDHTSAALGIPLESLALVETQALDRLCNWIWPGNDGSQRDNQLKELKHAFEQSTWADPAEHDPDRFIDPKTGKMNWRKAPWYLRFGAEGLGLTLIALVIVVAIPRVRVIYENRLEQQMKAADLSELAMPQASWDGDPDLGESTQGKDATAASESLDESLQNLDGGRTTAGTAPDNSKLKVGPAEIWRFNMRTDSPKDLRVAVSRVLTQIGATSDDGLQGVAAPGGVQFIALAPRDKVLELKTRLEELARASQTSQTLIKDPFAWVKSRSRQPIPEGQTRTVIWISQI